MQLAMQYDLFEEHTELSDIRMELQSVKESSDNVRRGMFKRHSELMKLILAQQQEIQGLRDLINGKKNKNSLPVKIKSDKVEDFFEEAK